MSGEELKACGHCGGEAAYDDYGLPDTRVCCRSCDLATRWHQSREEATTFWNRRHPLPEQPQEGVREDFLAQLRRVNSDRYEAWITTQEPIMLCEHCGRDDNSAAASGHNFCLAPFDKQEHAFTKPHPYLTREVRADAGIMFDAVELGGEVGELRNVVKKMEREDRGWRGSRAAPEDFADECADVLICLDKLARRRGVDLAEAAARKFNATSDKVGLPHKLPLHSPMSELQRMGQEFDAGEARND